MPWLFGPIAGAPVAAAADAWNGMGGYLGIMPAALAFAGLISGRRQPICWLMAIWGVVCIAASLRAPLLYPLALSVPLVGITLFFRYLDASWILCCITLASVFLDRLPTLTKVERVLARCAALGGFGVILGLALLLAGPLLVALWGYDAARPYEIAYFALSLLFLGMMTLPRRVVITFAIAEATVSFLFPLASFKHAHRLDWPLVNFLQEHVGLQRMALAASSVVSPNYASAFGFASINYDNLPVPERTAAFAHDHLDPDLINWAFYPKADWNRSDDNLRRTVQTHLKG